MTPLTLEWLPGRFAVCRLAPDAEIPAWVQTACDHQAGATPRVAHVEQSISTRLISITRTDRELSIVIDQSLIPANILERAGSESSASSSSPLPSIRIER